MQEHLYIYLKAICLLEKSEQTKSSIDNWQVMSEYIQVLRVLCKYNVTIMCIYKFLCACDLTYVCCSITKVCVAF